jgi:fimbrial chaperone protein
LRKTLLVKILAMALLLLPAAALAGSFRVVPIKVFMDARSKTAVLRVTNDGSEKVNVQISTKAWSQAESGRDEYKDTKDIIFFPRMADIRPGEERIIRLGYKGKALLREKTYRLFVEELPVSEPGEEMALKFALRLSVPIFIKPAKEVRKSSMEGAELKDGMVLVKVRNKGNSHFIVKKIKATGLDSSGAEVFSEDMGGWYVLSGLTRTYALGVPEKECLKATKIKVSVEVGKRKLEKDFSVTKAACRAPKKPTRKKTTRREGKG